VPTGPFRITISDLFSLCLGVPPQVLLDIDAKMAPVVAARKAAAEAEGASASTPAPPLVLMYGHSMAGAAIGVLTGNGKVRGCFVVPSFLSFSSIVLRALTFGIGIVLMRFLGGRRAKLPGF